MQKEITEFSLDEGVREDTTVAHGEYVGCGGGDYISIIFS